MLSAFTLLLYGNSLTKNQRNFTKLCIYCEANAIIPLRVENGAPCRRLPLAIAVGSFPSFSLFCSLLYSKCILLLVIQSTIKFNS